MVLLLKVGGGWLGRRVQTVSPTLADVHTDIFYLTGTYFVTPAMFVDGGVYRTVSKPAPDTVSATAGHCRTQPGYKPAMNCTSHPAPEHRFRAGILTP